MPQSKYIPATILASATPACVKRRGQWLAKDASGALGPLHGVARIYKQKNTKTHVFGNVSIQFGQAAEPESHVHAHLENDALWNHLTQVNEAEVIQGLRDHIKFIQDDAPALAASLAPGAPVEIFKLNQEHQKLSDVSDRSLSVTPLAVAGKGLRKKPVVLIDFEDSPARVLTSQMLTSGRLAEGFGTEGIYGVCYDPAALQMVLNMIDVLSLNYRTSL